MPAKSQDELEVMIRAILRSFATDSLRKAIAETEPEIEMDSEATERSELLLWNCAEAYFAEVDDPEDRELVTKWINSRKYLWGLVRAYVSD